MGTLKLYKTVVRAHLVDLNGVLSLLQQISALQRAISSGHLQLLLYRVARNAEGTNYIWCSLPSSLSPSQVAFSQSLKYFGGHGHDMLSIGSVWQLPPWCVLVEWGPVIVPSYFSPNEWLSFENAKSSTWKQYIRRFYDNTHSEAIYFKKSVCVEYIKPWTPPHRQSLYRKLAEGSKHCWIFEFVQHEEGNRQRKGLRSAN